MANKRIYYAIEQVQIAPVGTTNYTSNGYIAKGVQQCGINTKFNLEQVFELGQLAIYENIENLPDIEITLEKVIDGYPLLYHLLTKGATSASIAGRSNVKSQILMSIYDDTQESASGIGISEVECSGMFVSQVSYTFPVEGNCTESITVVGNNKVWRTSSFLSSGNMNNQDSPPGSGGVQRRQEVLFGSGYSILPTGIPGITSVNGTGYNYRDAAGDYGAHIQSIKISTNLGRENLNELGRKGPYHRYVNFPVEVRTEIECYSTRGDLVQALEDADNVFDERIKIILKEGLIVDCGTKNKLDSVNHTGGNAGARGGNVTNTFSYVNFNDMSVKHPQDPTTALWP